MVRLGACLLYVSVSAANPPNSSQQDEVGWWKGNIHTHSLWSDGNDFPEMIAHWYRSHGYHFLALSDHNVLSEGVRWIEYEEIVKRGGGDALEKYKAQFGDEWVETRGVAGQPDYEVRLKPLSEFRGRVEESGKFLMIQGEEISDRAEGVPVHLNATNLRELIKPMGGSTVVEAINNNLRAVEEQAEQTGEEILVHLNHPNFGWAITAEELAAVVREKYFEVYNGHPGVNHQGDESRPGVERMWDIANTIRLAALNAPPLFGLATDDSHHYHGTPGSRPGRGWIMVRAGALDAKTIIEAIKQGDFYASSGVTLDDVAFDSQTGVFELQVAAEDGAEYTTDFIGTRVGYDAASQPRVDEDGNPIRATRSYSRDVGEVLATVPGARPSFKLNGDELYVRAVVTSTQPHRDPSFEGQRKQAWTQPVGWQRRLAQKNANELDAAAAP